MSSGSNPLSSASKDANKNMSSGPAGGSCQSCGDASAVAPAPPASPADAAPHKKHFVAIQMLDQEGRPAAGEDFKLTLPDGTVQEGNLDQHGKARINDIDPGSCKITFPNLDKDSWEPK